MSLLYAMHQQYKLLLYICTRSEVRRLCMSPQQGQLFKGLSRSKRSPAKNGPPGSKTARRTCCNRTVAVTYPPMMPALKTEISKFGGTVSVVQRMLGLHDNIQAYLQLERDGNWYAYRSGVAKTAICKYANLSVTRNVLV